MFADDPNHGTPDPNRIWLHDKPDILAPELIGRPIAYYPRVANLTDHVPATIVLCQLIYWTGKEASGDGWIFKTNADLRAECGLTRHEFAAAKRRLVEKQLVYVEYAGWPRKTYYRVNLDLVFFHLRQIADEE